VYKNVEFRPAVEGDSEPIVSLLESATLPYEDLAGTTQVRFIVAMRKTHLIGCIGIEMTGGHALLRSLAVLQTKRGTGIGGQLLERAEHLCRHHNVVATYLLTLTAEKFFARRGYTRVSRDDVPSGIRSTSEFASVCPASSALMVKLF
jgi:amino-acid N-acetyltransferase